MLFLTFQAGNNRYALEARRVIEVVPRAGLRSLTGAPNTIAGLLNYRGSCVPVVDLCRVLAGAACNQLLSARVILTMFQNGEGRERMVGLLAERVTETITRAEADFSQVGLRAGPSRRQGLLAPETDGFIQRIQPEELLAGELGSFLVGPPEVKA